MSNKYSIITDKEISEKLISGEFKKDTIGLVRNKKGQIVKHFKEQEITDSTIPPTIIQINQNIIYHADLESIIESIIKMNNTVQLDELEEIYKIVLDKLQYYKNHKQRLDDLNKKTLEALSVFEERLGRYLDSIDTKNPLIEDYDRYFDVLNSHLNLIFIYIISAYWLHGELLSNDRIALSKIKNIEDRVRNVYMGLLINGDINQESVANSVYAYLFINGGKKIHLMDKLTKHDNRCKTTLDFFESFSELCISKKDHYNQEHSIKTPNHINSLENRVEFSEKLYQIMEKLDYLKNIYNELVNISSINSQEIDGDYVKDGEPYQLAIIPLMIKNDN